MTASPRALVTGATGFVGSHLVRRLAADGWAVHTIVRPGSTRLPLASVAGQVAVHAHDGSTEGMIGIVADARPAIVFHLASLFTAQHTPDQIVPLVNSNVLLGTQLAEAMARANVRHLVNTGTAWQHYQDEAYNPACLYAATKQAMEAMLRYYVEIGALRVITLELFDTYGPRDPRPKLFHLLRRAAAEQQALPMSAGEQLLDLVYIDDVVEAFRVAADRLIGGADPAAEVYAVSSGMPVRLKDLVQLYARVVGKPVPVTLGARPYRDREVMRPWTKGRRLPGWLPRVALEDGMRRMEGR